MSLAKVLCLTMDNIKTVQPFVFLAADSLKNSRIPCDSSFMDDFDLRPWIEQPSRAIAPINELFRRIKRSAKRKNKIESSSVTRRNIVKTNSTQQPKENNAEKKLIGNNLRQKNRINISIDSSPLQPVEINIKIYNNVSNRVSTVTKRKPTRKPSTSYHQVTVIGNINKPSGDNYLKPSYGIKPTNSYNYLHEGILAHRPSGYLSNSHGFIGNIATSNGGYGKPIKKPTTSSYSAIFQPAVTSEVMVVRPQDPSYNNNFYNIGKEDI